ncbi:hypothetical protein GJA_4334 [Janthinobacterium agaricidamnosum NBRC 102515 = DSM 9628]|uniref:Uncharacterized protein n=1 Tax=Janthinobacterium agaricidamnosum NBRC 102515 = DSM 9628 TaxID=1349767 RepID=W0VCD4_9BURK|nr:hypothetical protein GJA_4334 [Janthinobacterium agaricidamnosum NBRC 102515 = DSM 9628]
MHQDIFRTNLHRIRIALNKCGKRITHYYCAFLKKVDKMQGHGAKLRAPSSRTIID